MSTEYQLRLLDPFGTPIDIVSQDAISKLNYTLNVNAVGALTLTVARDAILDSWVKRDARIELYRTPEGGPQQLEGGTTWLLQTNTRGFSDRDGRYRRLVARTSNLLLGRRDVMYYANSAQSSKTSVAADDMMKAIVRENLGSSANGSPLVSPLAIWPSRDWSAYITVDADLGLGPSTTKAFAYRSVLSVLQDLARSAAQDGTPVFFDLVPSGALFAFRTWVGVRGADRTSGATQLVISTDRGSLGGTVEVTEDWSNLVTAVAAGGQGQDAARVLGAAYNATLIGQSPFGLAEAFMDATQLSVAESLNTEAASDLRANRPSKVLTGSLLSADGAVYGLNWRIGDRIVAEFENDTFIASIDSLTVNVSGNQETVTAAIRGET